MCRPSLLLGRKEICLSVPPTALIPHGRRFTLTVILSAPNNSGLRGLTTVPDPEASGDQVILAGLEGPGLMLRIDPARQHFVTTELDIPQFLAQHWGNLRTSYVIPAYNDIYPVT